MHFIVILYNLAEKLNMDTYTNIQEAVQELKAEYKLNDFEALQIACKIEKIDSFKKAFCITESNSVPTCLEAIAIALGFENDNYPQKIQQNILSAKILNC